jgi:hypothetical protein
VPILKWKQAEKNALADLVDKGNITPLIELVMPQYKGEKDDIINDPKGVEQKLILSFREKYLNTICDDILESWGEKPIFIDFSLLYTKQLRIDTVKFVLSKAKEFGLKLIPVINLSDDDSIKTTASALSKENGTTICLRLVCANFENIEKLNQDISELLALLDRDETTIDLLVDVKNVEELGGKYFRYIALSQQIDGIGKWNNYIFAGGAFPKDLSKYNMDEDNFIPRFEWENWNKIIEKGELKRTPIFADYTIRYPVYDQSMEFYHPTASIKYTLENSWFLLKGKKLKFEMYLGNAKLLMNDSKHYYGENFSAGDKFIADKGRHYDKYVLDPSIKGTGNNPQWISAGINHHLVCTAQQLSNLS